MARGRKPLNEPTVKIGVYLPKRLADRLDMLLVDPIRFRTRYGSKSELITKLVKEFFDHADRQH